MVRISYGSGSQRPLKSSTTSRNMRAPSMDIKTVSDSFPLFLMVGVLALGFFCASYVLGTTGTNIDLSSPEATIKTYCEAVIRADVSAVKQCIYEGNKVEEKSFGKPIWSSCRIV